MSHVGSEAEGDAAAVVNTDDPVCHCVAHSLKRAAVALRDDRRYLVSRLPERRNDVIGAIHVYNKTVFEGRGGYSVYIHPVKHIPLIGSKYDLTILAVRHLGSHSLIRRKGYSASRSTGIDRDGHSLCRRLFGKHDVENKVRRCDSNICSVDDRNESAVESRALDIHSFAGRHRENDRAAPYDAVAAVGGNAAAPVISHPDGAQCLARYSDRNGEIAVHRRKNAGIVNKINGHALTAVGKGENRFFGFHTERQNRSHFGRISLDVASALKA